jgi:hypothetical protein
MLCAASAQAAPLTVKLSGQLTPNGPVFGQTAPFPVNAVLQIDSSQTPIVMPGSARNGATLYGYNASQFNLTPITVGNTVFTEADLSARIPVAGYSADLWFDAPLAAGTSPDVWLFAITAAGYVNCCGGVCGSSSCSLENGASAQQNSPPDSANGSPLTVTVATPAPAPALPTGAVAAVALGLLGLGLTLAGRAATATRREARPYSVC